MGQVTVDHAAGRAWIGDTVLEVEPIGSTGTLRLAGTVVRPLTFGERARLVDEALADTDPETALLDLVGPASSGVALGPAATAIALHLAGAGSGAPGFATILVEVAAATGWGAADVLDRRATEVDALVRGLQRDGERPNLGAAANGDRAPDEGGWRRFVAVAGPTLGRVGPTAEARGATPADVARRLAEDLVARGREPVVRSSGQAAPKAEVPGTRTAATGGPPSPPGSPHPSGESVDSPDDHTPPTPAGRPHPWLGGDTGRTVPSGLARPGTVAPPADDRDGAAVATPGPDHQGAPADTTARPPITSTPLTPTDRTATDREPGAETGHPTLTHAASPHAAPPHAAPPQTAPPHTAPPHTAPPHAGSDRAPGTPPTHAAAPLARPAHGVPGAGSITRSAGAPPAAQRPGARHGGTSRLARSAAPAPPHAAPGSPEVGAPPSAGRTSGASGDHDVFELALTLALELDREADLRGVLP